jgi:hypothetical protein
LQKQLDEYEKIAKLSENLKGRKSNEKVHLNHQEELKEDIGVAYQERSRCDY